ncbi:MAG TPA: MBL fold metallo-hydrolase [Ruminococcaceae bacterium]|nr:MBL fold metallo-hydrolase [Oscillospiraceae bacterium]
MYDEIQVLAQSCIRICGEKIIYFDPFMVEDAPHDADMILLTHDHRDHYSLQDIEKVRKEETVFVLPQKMATRSDLPQMAKMVSVLPGNQYEVEGLSFQTVAAYNNWKPAHLRRSGWVGYVLQMNHTTYFVAGDTDQNKENSQVVCDVALVPIGGTFTMNAVKAAALINTIKPRVAIPTHYGTIVGKMEDADIFAAHLQRGIQVLHKLKNG